MIFSIFHELKQIPFSSRNTISKQLVDRKIKVIDINNVFYTDGSLINGSAGFGIYNSQITYFYRLNSPCTVFIAELSAIYHTISIIKNMRPNIYFICSDSFSSLLTLNSYHFNGKSHYYIWLIKNELSHLNRLGFTIKFLWVPSHSKIYGNEQADSLAKLGSKQGTCFERNLNAFEYYPKIKFVCQDKCQNLWDCSDMGRWYYSINPHIKNKAWFYKQQFSRNFIKVFCRLLTNHYALKSHLFRIDLSDSNICDCLQSYEDIDHVVFHCQRFDVPRRKFLDALTSVDKSSILSIRDLLATHDFSLYKLLFSFLKETLIHI